MVLESSPLWWREGFPVMATVPMTTRPPPGDCVCQTVLMIIERLEWAGVWVWPQEDMNSSENRGCQGPEHDLGGRDILDLVTSNNPPSWPLTPGLCLYQVIDVRNRNESLQLCVYLLESRKEGNKARSSKSGGVRENSSSIRSEPWFISLWLASCPVTLGLFSLFTTVGRLATDQLKQGVSLQYSCMKT